MDKRPPPPPHGSSPNPGKRSGLPDGNYDIFVIPPHSAGSGFLYLPSLQPHRNSFIAGFACASAVFGVWAVLVPAIKSWFSSLTSSGGSGILLLILAVGIAGWAYGKAQIEADARPRKTNFSSGTAPGTDTHDSGFTSAGPNPFSGGTSWQHTTGGSAWEKAREETRKREEERRKKEEAEKKCTPGAANNAWEKARAREREAREKEAREKLAQERAKKEQEARSKNYQKPTAQSYADEDEQYSFRPYDNPAPKPPKHGSQSSFYSEAGSAWGGSQSTSKSTPPPSQRGAYSTKDENKIKIKAVYAFTDLSTKPAYQLIAGFGSVTDGLVLKMTTEGLFIDDDVRGVGQREWDVKAWTLKLVESADLHGYSIVRACVRDADNKKYVFIIEGTEGWKVALGLQRLRRGSQVRSLGVNTLPQSEASRILSTLGWS